PGQDPASHPESPRVIRRHDPLALAPAPFLLSRLRSRSMSRLCAWCGERPATRRGKSCRRCYELYFPDNDRLDVPDGHPFLEERKRRIARMMERAARRLPLFEEVRTDLA